MPNYRKKPIIIEARQFPTDGTPAEAHAIYQWVEKNTLGSFEPLAVIEGREPWPESGVTIDPRDGRMVIATLEGGHWVTPGDFIIRGVQGEFYPCKSDIFEATYEPAETTPAHHETPDVTELRDQIAGTIHRRICEHSREDCIENLGKCERATDSAMPLISTALDEGHATESARMTTTSTTN